MTLAQPRLDFRRSQARRGKKCGETYIAPELECHEGKTKKGVNKAAVVALGAGLTAAAVYGVSRRNRIEPVQIQVRKPPVPRLKPGVIPQLPRAKHVSVEVQNEFLRLSADWSSVSPLRITGVNLKHNFITIASEDGSYRGAIGATPDRRLVRFHLNNEDIEGRGNPGGRYPNRWEAQFDVDFSMDSEAEKRGRSKGASRSEYVAVLSRVERMLQATIKDLPDRDIIEAFPITGGRDNAGRARVYMRFGFSSMFEGEPDDDFMAVEATVKQLKRRSRRNDQARLDRRSPRARKGKKCGETYIAKHYNCDPDKAEGKAKPSAPSGGITPRQFKTIALTAGALAGGALLGYAWSRQWDDRFRQSQLLSSTRKPDPEREELRRRRLLGAQQACSRRDAAPGVGELVRLAQVEVAARGTLPRVGGACQAATQIGEDSATAKLYLHTNSAVVFKAPAQHQGVTAATRATATGAIRNAIVKAQQEALIHTQAQTLGVQTPTLYAFNRKTGVIAMEYLEDYDSLRDALNQGSKFSEVRMHAAMKGFRDSMRKAHMAGIVHRDLHPGNIFIHRNSTKAKIIDWGEAYSMQYRHPTDGIYSIKGGISYGLNIDMEMIVRRSWRPFRVADTEAVNWLQNRHRDLYDKTSRGISMSLPEMQSRIDPWYRDLDALVEWKKRYPLRTIALNQSLL